MENVEFVLIAEGGSALEAQAVLLCESLRRFGGALAGSPLTVVSPRPDRRPGADSLRRLEALGAEYLALDLEARQPEYATSFRVHALAHLARRPGPPILVQCDSDTIFVAEPALLDCAGPAAARPVDIKGMSSAGPGDPFEEYWVGLGALCGVDAGKLPWVTTTTDRVRIRANWNGGLVAARRASGIFQRTEEFFDRIVAAGVPPRDGARTRSFLTGTGKVSTTARSWWGTVQAALALAADASGHPIEILPPGYNFPLHQRRYLFDRIPVPLVHLHYHWLATRAHGGGASLLDPRLGLAPEVQEWLRERLPLD